MNEPKDCLEIECERDGGHVYEVTAKGIEACAFCGKRAESGAEQMDQGYAFCCPVVGVYRCKKPDCRCVENWNAERASELSTPERRLVARARHYLAENAAESGADVLIAELADTLEACLPVVRQEAV